MSLPMDTGVALCISKTQNLLLRRQREVDSDGPSAIPSSLTGELCGLGHVALRFWQMGRSALKIMVTT